MWDFVVVEGRSNHIWARGTGRADEQRGSARLEECGWKSAGSVATAFDINCESSASPARNVHVAHS
jgi:hypothetical protein